MRFRIAALFGFMFASLFIFSGCFGGSGLSEEDVKVIVNEKTQAISDKVANLEQILSEPQESGFDFSSLNAREFMEPYMRQVHVSMQMWVSPDQARVLLPEGTQLSMGPNGLVGLRSTDGSSDAYAFGTLFVDYVMVPGEFGAKFSNAVAGLSSQNGIDIAPQQVEIAVILLGDPSLGDTGDEVLYQGTLSGLPAGVLNDEHGVMLFKRPAARLIADAPQYDVNQALSVQNIREGENVLYSSIVFHDVVTNGMGVGLVSRLFSDTSRFSDELRPFFAGTFYINFDTGALLNGSPVFAIRNGTLTFAGMVVMARDDGQALVLSAEQLLRMPALMESQFGGAAGVGGDGPPRLPTPEDLATEGAVEAEVDTASANSATDDFGSAENVSIDNSDSILPD